MFIERQEKLSIPKFGIPQTKASDGDNETDASIGKSKVKYHESGNDLSSFATLPSDSSPFHEKYHLYEDSDILGEGTHTIVR